MSGGPIRRGGHALASVISRSRVAHWLDRFPFHTIRRVLFSMRIGGVLETLDALEAAGVRGWLAGGWGVDALLGRTTRSHSDVDIVLDVRDDPVPAALAALGSLGLDHIDEGAEGGRWMAQLMKVTNRRGAVIELLPVDPTRLPSASPFTMGVLAGRRVPCLSAELQVAFHRSYRRRWSQQRDLARLCAWSGDARPPQPPGPLGRWRRRLGHRLARAWQRLLRTERLRESALLILVPAADDLVGESRHASSDAGSNELPPHITVLYPFVPASRIDDALERDVAAVAEGFPPFSFRLAHVGRFPDVVYLVPEPAAPFIDLTKTFAAYWPEHPPYGGTYDEPIPHMTVVDVPERQDAPQAIERHLPIEAAAAELALMVEGDDGTWRVLRQFPLGGDRSDAGPPLEQPVTAQTTTTIRTEVRPSLHGVQELWDAFVDAAPHASVFLRSWWLDATASDSTEFVIVYQDGAFVGGIGLDRDQRLGVARYRFAGLPNPHGVDAVASPGAADTVVEALRAWFARPGSRMFDLEGVPPDSLVARAAPPRVRVEVLERAPFIRVDGDFEDYLARRPRKRRQDTRRVLRRLAERDVTYRVAPAGDVERSLVALERTHLSRWGMRSVFSASFGRFARAARVGAAIGEVTFHEAVHDGEVVASLVTVDHGDVSAFYQMGRDPTSPYSQSSGTLIKACAIERAVRNGVRVIDLCYGDPPAKLDWADDALDVFALRWSVGLGGYSVRALRRTIGRSVRWLRSRRQPGENDARVGSGNGVTPSGASESTTKPAM